MLNLDFNRQNKMKALYFIILDLHMFRTKRFAFYTLIRREDTNTFEIFKKKSKDYQ